MIAFVSDSIGESENYVLTLLAQKLRERGFSVTSSYNQTSPIIDFQTESNIKNSSLFIGVVTNVGNPTSTNRVYSELNLAAKYEKPIIFLAEETVELDPKIDKYPNTIRFNRFYPNVALEEVKRRIKISQDEPQKDNTLAWILGGVAALALISMLSSDEK